MKNHKKNIFEGIKFSLGIILGLSLFFGIVFAVGFHSANEILGGKFSGNFEFDGNVSFNEKIYGGLPQRIYFSTPGTYNWQVPEGIRKIRVYVAGAGGAASIASSSQDGSGLNGENSYFNSTPQILATGGGGSTEGNAGEHGVGSYAGNGLNGDINIRGGGSNGGNTISYNTYALGNGGNGGLAIKDLNVNEFETFNLYVGKKGLNKIYPAGGTKYDGSDGYIIIEY